MRNLWFFIVKYYAFFLFLFLEGISISLIVKNNTYQNAAVLNSANSISGELYLTVSNFKEYLSLKTENDSLANENARLLTNQKKSSYSGLTDSVKYNDTTLKKQYIYYPARIINNSTNRRNNYLTLNRGSRHGIKKNMGVICGSGVVGIVNNVSENFSTVISILHKDTKLSGQLDSTKDIGSIIWEGFSPQELTLLDVPSHVEIRKGEKITTTGFSSIFPEGILIGVVRDFKIKEGDNFYSIRVRMTTRLQNLQYVYIVKNVLADEQNNLESTLKYD